MSAYSAYKLKFAFIGMREAIEARIEIGKAILELCDHLMSLPEDRQEDRYALLFQITDLAAYQELEFHKMAIFGTRISVLLQSAVKGAGAKISPADGQLLDQYRELRNHYEHVVDQFGEEDPEVDFVTITDDGVALNFKAELPRDEIGRIVTKSGTADLSSTGVRQFEILIRKYWREMETNSIAKTERFFRRNPEMLPDPEEIGDIMLFVHNICQNQGG